MIAFSFSQVRCTLINWKNRVIALYPKNWYIITFLALLYGAEIPVMTYLTAHTKGRIHPPNSPQSDDESSLSVLLLPFSNPLFHSSQTFLIWSSVCLLRHPTACAVLFDPSLWAAMPVLLARSDFDHQRSTELSICVAASGPWHFGSSFNSSAHVSKPAIIYWTSLPRSSCCTRRSHVFLVSIYIYYHTLFKLIGVLSSARYSLQIWPGS